MTRRILLALALLAAISAPVTLTARRAVIAAMPIARTDLPWWRARHDAVLAELRAHPPELLWLGDSITQQWERTGPPEMLDFVPVWNRFYGDRQAANLGFIGDTTANLLWRIENGETAGIAPKLAIVLIGANNLGRVHWSAEDSVAGIEANIAALRARLPHTQILLLGVLPSDRSDWVTETTVEINRSLAERFAHRDFVTYLDVTKVFMQDGKLDHALFIDPQQTPPGHALHPTAQGQARIAAAIEPTVARLMGDRVHVLKD
jgi:lysophospholipase L1-like esterase